jgi:histidine phosphotransferase ChpT
MLNDLEVSELLCTKFCHDLAGPIGAINNGIDFFESDNQQMKEKAYELVKLSSKQAVNRLTFFRQAYGTTTHGSEVHLSELKSLILKLMEDTKLQLSFEDITIDDTDIISSKLGKLLLNIVIIAAHVIMSNGLITIKMHSMNNQLKIKVSAEGAIHKLDEELINILNWNLEGIEISSRNIQHYYTALLSRNTGSSIAVVEENNKIFFNITSSK